MSFSFSVRGATVAAVVAAATAKMDEAVAAQPSHAADRDAVVAAAKAYAGMLGKPEKGTQEIMLNIHGSLSGAWDGSTITRTTGAAIGVQAALAPILPAE